MPAKPAWLLKIPQIRSILADVNLPVIDRASIERIFGLRRCQAIEVANNFGAYQAGRTLLIDRARLIAELDKILAGGEYLQEHARHEKLSAALTKFQRSRRAQEVRIAVSPDVFSTQVTTLPETVHLRAGKLLVEFSGCEDLVSQLFTVAQAALNDYDSFRNMSEGVTDGRA